MGGSYRKAEALGHFTALLPWHWPIGMIFQQKLPGIARVPPRSCSPGVDGCLSNSFALFLQYINNTYIYIYIQYIYIYICVPTTFSQDGFTRIRPAVISSLQRKGRMYPRPQVDPFRFGPQRLPPQRSVSR